MKNHKNIPKGETIPPFRPVVPGLEQHRVDNLVSGLRLQGDGAQAAQLLVGGGDNTK